jgi:hypothetical protein
MYITPKTCKNAPQKKRTLWFTTLVERTFKKQIENYQIIKGKTCVWMRWT